MNLFEQFALGLQSLWFTLRECGRPRLWAPFLVPFVVQCAGIGLLALTAHPLLSWLLAPIVVRLAGPDALHYPGLFVHLPGLALTADLLVVSTLGALATGAATRLFASVFEGRSPSLREAWSETARRAWPLLVAQLPVTLLLVGIGFALDAFGQARVSSITRAMLPAVQLVLGTLVQALFAYVPALVMLGRLGPLLAWRRVPAMWGRGFLPALVIFVVALLVLLPMQLLARQSGAVVARGLPELTMALTALLFASSMVASWLVSGAATLVWMSALSGHVRETR